MCIHLIDPEQHTGLMNVEIVTHPAVNVDNAIQEGKKQIALFESSWPARHFSESAILGAILDYLI